MNTRLAEPADVAAIADLVRLAFSRQSRPTNPPSSASRETAVTIGDHLARGGAAVAEHEGKIVGVVLWVEEDSALYLSRLAVHPAHRQQGIARRLIAEVEHEARRRRMTRMTAGVRVTLDDNRRLFESCGFTPTTLHSHEGFSEPTWVLMERRL